MGVNPGPIALELRTPVASMLSVAVSQTPGAAVVVLPAVLYDEFQREIGHGHHPGQWVAIEGTVVMVTTEDAASPFIEVFDESRLTDEGIAKRRKYIEALP